MTHYENGMIKQAVLGWLSMVLFLLTINSLSIYYQLRGALSSRTTVGPLLSFGSALCMALLLPHMERVIAKGERRGALARTVFAIAMFAPIVVFALDPLACEQELECAEFILLVQMFLTGLSAPVAMHFFFRNVSVPNHTLFMALAVGVVCIFWAMLLPILGDAGVSPTMGTQRGESLLYVLRCLTGTAFAVIVYHLLSVTAEKDTRDGFALGDSAHGIPDVRQEAPENGRTKNTFLKAMFFVVPLTICGAINGFTGYSFYIKLLAVGEYPEYIPLALAGLFPLAAVLIAQKGEKAMRIMLAFGALLFALTRTAPWFQQIFSKNFLLSTSSVAYQFVFFISVLACARLGACGRRPILTVSLPWLAMALMLPGTFMLHELLDLFDVPHEWAVSSMGLLSCLAGALLLSRHFALPEPPIEPSTGNIAPDDAVTPAANGSPLVFEDNAAPEGNVVEADDVSARVKDFAKNHQLSRREQDVLWLLLRGYSTEDMAEALNLKESSVRRYVCALLQKTGTSSRLGLVTALTVHKNRVSNARPSSSS